jgi:predicted dehydrogenase
MKQVRLGIIGMGNIGKYHADYLLHQKVSRAELVAVADAFGPLEAYQALKTFKDGGDLIRSGAVDAVIIATPHYQHTTLGIAALEAGLHVIVEKPISVHKADAERLIAAHARRPDLVFSAMFQLRTEPRYVKIKRLITSGELGEIIRVNWIITDWFRTEAYYASGGWRATWKGEGGGVLLNQCPHNLDLIQWLAGMPARVRGFCQLGRYHQIEVEDNVTVYFEYPNGATGVFITSTGEAPGANRLEIAGTRGRLVLEQGRLSFLRNEVPMDEFSRTSKAGFARPDTWQIEVPFDNAPAQHATITQNFVDAILDGSPLIAPAEEGMRSVELANAALYSSLTGQTVELPLDSAAYERKLNELIAQSRFEKKAAVATTEDFTKSFVR